MPISQGMAASPLPIQQPVTPQDASVFFDKGDWTQARLQRAREVIRLTVERNDIYTVEYRRRSTEHVDRTIDILRQNPDVDIDIAIETLEAAEESCVSDRTKLTRNADTVIKDVAKTAPEALALLNEFRGMIVRAYNEIAALHRDARWRLLASRAELQPSRGIGPINGSGEPPEGYEDHE